MAVIVRSAAASDVDSSGAPVVRGSCLGALGVGGPLVFEGEDAVAAAGVQAQGAPAHDVLSSRGGLNFGLQQVTKLVQPLQALNFSLVKIIFYYLINISLFYLIIINILF